MNNLNKKQEFLDSLGWSILGLISLAYILFANLFAELHVQLPFLDFPIFIGEVVLMACSCIFILQNGISIKNFQKKDWIIIAFFTFVVIKALYGYSKWGPLAFRDAALLYYPVFIIFAYSFYRTEFLSTKNADLYLLFILSLFILRGFNEYWTFTCFSLAFALIYAQPNRRIKFVMFAILLLAAPYRYLFATSRMMIISNVLGILFLSIAFCLVLKIRSAVKVIVLILGMTLIVGGITRVSDKNSIKSIVKLGRIIEIFKGLDDWVKNYPLSKDAMETPDKVRIYNPDVWHRPHDSDAPVDSLLSKKTELNTRRQENVLESKSSARGLLFQEAEEQIYLPEETVVLSMEEKNVAGQRHLGLAYNSVIFRLFIWRDMLIELSEKRPILGFDFGKPILPKSLYILGWGAVQFKHDGWVAAHNSYLHIIYRTGVIGAAFLMTILGILLNMIKKSIKHKSVVGILLCACIINWFVAANFLLIFELPYTAIPIWSLFGVTCAYVSNLTTKNSVQ